MVVSILLGVAALAAVLAGLLPERLAGTARVIDGDSLAIGVTRVRLHGIDAPELRQNCEAEGALYACGRQARAALVALVEGEEVSCAREDVDRYGRIVGVCRAGGVELNRAMVRAGWALAYRRYATTYVGDEQAAQRARRGMWRGAFVAPAEFRRLKDRR